MAYRDYTADGSYWTARKLPNGRHKVVRVDQNYAVQEEWGVYERSGAAVGAAAQLAYEQGKRDALAVATIKIQEALATAGFGRAPDVPRTDEDGPETEDIDLAS